MTTSLVVPASIGVASTLLSGIVTWNCLLKGEPQGKSFDDPMLDGVKQIAIRRNGVVKRINVVTDAEEVAKNVRQEFDIPRSQMMAVQRGDDIIPLRFENVVNGERLDLPDDTRDWVEVSNQLRKDGNSHFTTGNTTGRRSEYTEALILYKKAYQIVPADGGDEAVSMICLAKNNCAQIFLKLDSCKYADQICTEVLSSDPKNMKALYRRGVARRRLSLLQQSLSDQKLALEIATSQDSPLVSEIKREYDEVSRLLAVPKPVSLSKSQDLD